MAPRSYPRVYFELILIGVANFIGFTLPASFLPILARDLDPSGLLVGLAVSVWFLSRIFIELPAGAISDRLGRRKLLVAGLGLSALGALLSARASSIYVLILGRGVWGMGSAIYFMNNMALIFDLFDAGGRGRALGIFYAVEFIGMFAGIPLGALLAGSGGYANVFYFAMALALGSMAGALASPGFRALDEGRRVGEAMSLGRSVMSLRGWGIAVICFGAFTRMLVFQGIFSTVLELYLHEDLLFPLVQIGLTLSMRTAGHIIATVSAGFLSDRLGRRLVVTVGFLLDAASMAAITATPDPGPLAALGFTSGLGEGLVFTGLMVLLSDLAPHGVRGVAIGLYRTFQDVGGSIGPVAFMLAYGDLGHRFPFYLAAGLNLFNVVVLHSMRLKLSPPPGEGVE